MFTLSPRSRTSGGSDTRRIPRIATTVQALRNRFAHPHPAVQGSGERRVLDDRNPGLPRDVADAEREEAAALRDDPRSVHLSAPVAEGYADVLWIRHHDVGFWHGVHHAFARALELETVHVRAHHRVAHRLTHLVFDFAPAHLQALLVLPEHVDVVDKGDEDECESADQKGLEHDRELEADDLEQGQTRQAAVLIDVRGDRVDDGDHDDYELDQGLRQLDRTAGLYDSRYVLERTQLVELRLEALRRHISTCLDQPADQRCRDGRCQDGDQDGDAAREGGP